MNNQCPKCQNDLSKECVVYVFAFHWQKGTPVYQHPGDATPIIQCSCGAWLDEDHKLLNS